jgi:hypothetical protein
MPKSPSRSALRPAELHDGPDEDVAVDVRLVHGRQHPAGSFVDLYIGVIGQNLAGGAQIAYLAAGALITMAGAALITLKAATRCAKPE